MLERNLGVRLFQRSTRKLTLTEAGEWFLSAIQANLEGLHASIASIATRRGAPSGVLKVSTSTTFGVEQILPLLPDFLKRYPDIRLDWSFHTGAMVVISLMITFADGVGPSTAKSAMFGLFPLPLFAAGSPPVAARYRIISPPGTRVEGSVK